MLGSAGIPPWDGKKAELALPHACVTKPNLVILDQTVGTGPRKIWVRLGPPPGNWVMPDPQGWAQGSFVEAEAEVEAERLRQRRGRLNSRQGPGEATPEKPSFP